MSSPSNFPRYDASGRILCRYYLRGTCFYGDDCRFSHNLNLEDGGAAASTSQSSGSSSGTSAPSKTSSIIIEVNDLIKRLTELSKDKTCGICLDIVMEKEIVNDRQFGILPNCTHIFCLKCIRQWRQTKSNEVQHQVTKACPECRVVSDFVCPSHYYAEKKEDKDMLINNYRTGLSTRDCRKFRKGKGKCPFGNECFYKHALPNGTLVDVGKPTRRRNRNQSNNPQHILAAAGILDEYLTELFSDLTLSALMNHDSDDEDNYFDFDDDEDDYDDDDDFYLDDDVDDDDDGSYLFML